MAIHPGNATLHELEREIIVNMLTLTHGNQSEAARLLGLRESTLRYRLRKFRIASPRARAHPDVEKVAEPPVRRAKNA